MYEAARINASIELFAECFGEWEKPRPLPSDIVINRYFTARRYIGSKDRGAIAAFCYLMIRNFATLNWHIIRHCEPASLKPEIASAKPRNDGNTARLIAIAATALINKKTLVDLHNIFNGEKFFPYKMGYQEVEFAKSVIGKELLDDLMPDWVRYNYPEWLVPDSDDWREEMTALNQEAPVDLRVNTLHATREELIEELTKEGFEVEATPISPIGVRMQTRAPVFTSDCFKKGWFEMQDEGSQIASLLLDAKAGEKVIDFCAGAGGKTLALAASMKNKGRILAWDTSEKRLKQMSERLKRAKVDNVQLHVLESEKDPFIKRHKDSADKVLIDAPCSGSGTWRRNPDLKWRFRPQDLEEITVIQQRILDSAHRLVKVGGYLLYVTCSILESENESQIEKFLAEKTNFRVATKDNLCSNSFYQIMNREGFLKLTPYKNGTDGFFASLLQRLE